MSAAIYRVEPGAGYDELSVTRVAEPDVPGGLRHIKALSAGGRTYLMCVDEAGAASALAADANGLTPTESGLDLGRAWDIVEPFVLGGDPHLLAYEAAHGGFAFFPVTADLRTRRPPYEFARMRAPGVSAGFSVAQPVVVGGLVYVLGYSFDSGKVNAYSLTVTATPAAGSPPGTPPLLAQPVWDHEWARKWTRFAFFRLGGEVYFLKTNIGRLNVNIDHLLDTPALGTVEVGTYLELEDALSLDIVRPFYVGGGDPHFVAYMTSGVTRLYRIHGDCQGWTKAAELDTVAGATQLVPYRVDGTTFLLVSD